MSHSKYEHYLKNIYILCVKIRQVYSLSFVKAIKEKVCYGQKLAFLPLF